MTHTDRLCLVQFLHPGNEHRPDSAGHKAWNRQKHRRKFLRCSGRRFGKDFEEPLHFWAEWEPESAVLAHILDRAPGEPEFIFEPYYVPPISYKGLKNTDPFVFGNAFLYTGCQQYRAGRPTQLRFLDRGSVILFGSRLGGDSFALDTVFVVDRWEDHDSRTFSKVLRQKVSDEYMEVTLSAWYDISDADRPCGVEPSELPEHCGPTTSDLSWRLYWGATPERPVGEMFSFFPCRPAAGNPRGFSHPIIHIEGTISDSLAQGFKLCSASDTSSLAPKDVRDLYANVRGQIESTGLSLGVYAELPERRRQFIEEHALEFKNLDV